jgi:hypothetical protein
MFTSQYGTVNLSSLPVVSIDGRPPRAPAAAAPPPTAPASPAASENEADVFAAIERLAELHGKGILTDDEYGQKKAELLSRL